MENKVWYLGLDIGTASVGWAATDTEYKIIRKNKKRLWGVRLFEEADTAKDRRIYRSKRRRLARRKWRLNLLEELFSEEVAKIDPNFYLRLKESKFHYEDKFHKASSVLFNDKDYTDKDYYREYPTIYHLRSSLMTEKEPDIRKVFLSVHHILKNRGHFLYKDLSVERNNLKDLIKELLETGKFIDIEEIDMLLLNKIEEISYSKISKKDKENAIEELFKREKNVNNVKQLKKVFKLIFGGILSLSDLFDDESYKEVDKKVKKISFVEKNYDEIRYMYEEILKEDKEIEILDLAKKCFNCITLDKITQEGKTLSESKVELFEKHKNDLAKFKALVKNDSKLSEEKKDELYRIIFKEDNDKVTNYVNYIKDGKEGKGCSYEDFKKFLVKELAKLQDNGKKNKILTDLELETFLPLQRTKDNSVVPYQIHREELIKILDNAEKYYSFLKEKDESGYTVKEKIIQLLEFRIPYYVGPLNSHKKANEGGFAWSVRNKGEEKTPVTPWNYSKVIDETASAEKFITNLTNKCTYLKGEEVLPKHSLLYSEFALLNELNALRYDGNRISVEARNTIIEKLFKEQGKKVRKKTIKELLKIEGYIDGNGEISGIDKTVKNDLESYRDFKKILGDKFNTEHVENIILWLTIFDKGEGKKLVKEKIKKEYRNIYTEGEISEILKLNYSGWGKFSRNLLTEITSKKLVNESTGECLNIINAMRYNNILFMELLTDRFDYMGQIEDFNKALQKEVTEITPDILEDLYVSPAVKRSIWQTIRIVEELKKIIGCEPAKIFIETTRKNKTKKDTTSSRKETLEEVYNKISSNEDIMNLEKELEYTFNLQYKNKMLKGENNFSLKRKKLFLYYLQLGRCVYSGESIKLDKLFNDNYYNIDHIYPRSKVKDDSIYDNLVLVTREKNEKKEDKSIFEVGFQTSNNKRFWKFLKEKKLITEEKYYRLTRTSEFTDYELTGFIARQLVETSQSVKEVASILRTLNPNSTVCYSKAENIIDFRKNFGKIKDGNRQSKNTEQLIKVREINDYHHAKDAYLNIVVGNVYDTKFTRNPYNYISNSKNGRNYSLNNMFYTDVRNSNTIAWEMNKTVKQIEKVMDNNNILVTRRVSEKKGALYDATIYKANQINEKNEERYQSVKKSNDILSNITKYGGFGNIKIAYYTIVSYEILKKKYIRILPIPIYILNNRLSEVEFSQHIYNLIQNKKNDKIVNFRIIYNKLLVGHKIKLNDYLYYVGGKNGDSFDYDNAIQILLDKDSESYIKIISKYYNDKNLQVCDCEKITKENNIKLYKTLIDLMKKDVFKKNKYIFGNRKPTKFDILNSNENIDLFNETDEENQVRILLNILNILTNKKTKTNLNLNDILSVKGETKRGKHSFNLSSLDQFSIIEQSVTGFYEKEITIIGDKGNDVGNSNS